MSTFNLYLSVISSLFCFQNHKDYPTRLSMMKQGSSGSLVHKIRENFCLLFIKHHPNIFQHKCNDGFVSYSPSKKSVSSPMDSKEPYDDSLVFTLDINTKTFRSRIITH